MTILEEKYVVEYIMDILKDAALKPLNIKEEFHHNCGYNNAPSICQYGILSLNELNKIGITQYTEDILEKMGDTDSHINGIDKISLSIVGLKDLYKDEDVYNPYNPDLVDFLVSKEVKATRSTTHYGNEYLADKIIGVEYLTSLDIRLLKLIENSRKNQNISNEKLKIIIENFNYLKDIAIQIKKTGIDIPIRERSNENISLDVDALTNIKKVILKKTFIN